MKSALLIHVYYLSEFEKILDILSDKYFEKIYITTTDTNYASVRQLCERTTYLNKFEIILVKNIGYDLRPFLIALDKASQDGIDLVCKLHTKKGSANLENYYEDIKPIWGNILYTSMLNDISSTIDLFVQHSDLSLLFPESMYKSSKYLGYGNEYIVTELLSEIGFSGDPSVEVGFAAGTMFWARIEALAPLLNLDLDKISEKEDKVVSSSGKYSSYWHAIERLIGYLPLMYGGKVALSFASDLKHSEFKLLAIDVKHADKYINRSGVGISLVSELFLEKNYGLINKFISGDDIYQETSNVLGIDPVIYYLRYGVFLGEELVPWFNSYAYWFDYPNSINNRYNPLVHYFKYNKSQPILPATSNIEESIRLVKKSNLFDASFYLRENPDVANSGIYPLRHFCCYGWKEWRDPSSEFELLKYYQDVFHQKDINTNPLIHYSIWKDNISLITKLKCKVPLCIKIAIKNILSK